MLPKDYKEHPEVAKMKAKAGKEESKTSKCPHNHKFGIDTDTFNECDTCVLWSDCIDAKEKK